MNQATNQIEKPPFSIVDKEIVAFKPMTNDLGHIIGRDIDQEKTFNNARQWIRDHSKVKMMDYEVEKDAKLIMKWINDYYEE